MKNTISSYEERLQKITDESKAQLDDMYRKTEEVKAQLGEGCPTTPAPPIPDFQSIVENNPPPAALSCARSRETFVASSHEETNANDDGESTGMNFSLQDYMNRILLNTLYINRNTIYSK